MRIVEYFLNGGTEKPCGREGKTCVYLKPPHGREEKPHGPGKKPCGRRRKPCGRRKKPCGHLDPPHGGKGKPCGHGEKPCGREARECPKIGVETVQKNCVNNMS